MTQFYLTLIIALVGVAASVTELVKRLIKTDNKVVNTIISWVVSIGVAFGAWVIGYLPPISQPDWLWILIEGIMVGIAGQWAYGKDIVKKILDFVFSWINGEKWYLPKEDAVKEEVETNKEK